MSFKLDDIQYNAALKLNAEYRYHYFVESAKKGLEIFVLKKEEDDILFLETDENEETISVLPVWSHERYALNYAEHNEIASGYHPQPISLAVFLETWWPQLRASGIEYAVFPVGENDCNIVTDTDLQKDFDYTSAK